jgi:salicylate hydroxylase/6-hydroxynicotinate 3-monooxygenase
MTKWWGEDRHFVIYTISRGSEVYFVTSLPEPAPTGESWSAKGDMPSLREAFAGFPEKVRQVLQYCPEAYRWGIYIRDPLPRWSDGSVVLLGDAAHPMTPYLAQGAAMALEDAIVLARCIDSAGPSSAAFEQYERIRKDRASRVQQLSGTNPALGGADLKWLYSFDPWSVPLT